MKKCIEPPYKHLTPFKRCVLQNFPFIEADFDALTNYGLLCKIVEYLNKVIASQNEVQANVEVLNNAFIELKSYVDNYFDNLDVQDEINNKLDQMADDGTLQEIIAEYLDMGATWAYKTVEEMLEASNLKNGSIAQTLGYYSAGDGGAATYLVTSTEPTGYYETNGTLYFKLIVKDRINVKQVGLKGDNESDEWSAFSNLLSKVSDSKIYLYFPEGNYVFEKHNSYLTLKADTTLEGNNATIIFNDSESSGSSLFSGANARLTIKGLSFKGTFDTVTSQTNAAMLYYSTSLDSSDVLIENCSFESFRNDIFSMANCNSLRIKNSTYYNIGRDSNRFLNCAYSCVTNCKFELCGDDVVSCHGDIPNSTHIFAHNKVIKSLGVGYLGGKNIDIHDNTFINPFILFKSGRASGEGGDTEVINFHDNYVLQPIKISTGADNRLTWIGNGTKKILFNNNTLKDGSAESFSKLNLVGVVYTNQSVYKGHYIIATLDSTYTHEYLQFNDNYCDVKNGPSSLALGNTRFMLGYYDKMDMYRNTIENFYSNLCVQASTKKKWNVRDNYFNGDKEHLLTTDGAWASSTTLRVFNPYPDNFENNTLRNVSGNYGLEKPNRVLYQPDGKYMNPISNSVPSVFVPYDESTGEPLNDIVTKSGSMPSSGYYHAGTFVMSNYTNDNTPIGWYRKTTGNAHELGTDWIALYVKSSPIS